SAPNRIIHSLQDQRGFIMKTKGMRVLVVGSGAREHVLWWAIRKSPFVEKVFCAPGNGGIPSEFCHDVEAINFSGLWRIVREESINLVIVDSNPSLICNLVQSFVDRDIAAFGPTKAAAKIGLDKGFSDGLCRDVGITLARCDTELETEVTAVCDGTHAVLLPPAHSCASGRGAYSPIRISGDMLQLVEKKIFLPILNGLKHNGRPYHGALTASIKLNSGDPQLCGLSCGFSRRTSQVVIPRLKTDIVDLMLRSLNRDELAGIAVEVGPKSAVGVSVRSEKSQEIPVSIPPDVCTNHRCIRFFHEKTRRENDGRLMASEGEVVWVVGSARQLRIAREKAYTGVEMIKLDGKQFRSDIANGV
ncbi:MAG: phosphoribosylglycinamide synthetase C domain-containing protein, partial [Patescibacteria group bacterium]